jgi:hypothetical protein
MPHNPISVRNPPKNPMTIVAVVFLALLGVFAASVIAAQIILKRPILANQPPAPITLSSEELFPLKVSSNGRYLVQKDGVTPFYVIADTAWTIYSLIAQEEAELYLEDRHEKGFNTINTHALPWDITGTNAHGQRPFLNDNMATPNDAYFEQVDWVINKAAEKGMLILIGPAWLTNYTGHLDAAKARLFGEYMGQRYKDFDNIIWFMGGDIVPTPREEILAEEMAAGIQQYDNRHLITFHPKGWQTSASWFHYASWLAFNTIQTYEHNSYGAYLFVTEDYNRIPVKPTWNMEPNYENQNENNAYSVRLAEGWSALSGAFGVSYGCYPIWNIGSTEWKPFLNMPGTIQFAAIGKAIQSREFYKLVPDLSHKMITSGHGLYFGDRYVTAALASDGSFGMAYLPSAREITVDMTQFNGKKTVKWLDPTNNTYTTAGVYRNKGSQTFAAQPANSAGQDDWFLIIE